MVMSAVSSVRTPGRVGDGDAALPGGRQIDMVDAGAEGGDEAQIVAGLRKDPGIDPVGHGGHQDVGDLHRLDQLGLGQRMVVEVQTSH